MIVQIVGGIIRAVMAAYGGKLVEQGFISSDQLTQVIGAVIVLVTIGWSAWQKSRARTVPGAEFNANAPVKKATRVDSGEVQWAVVYALSGVALVWAAVSFFLTHIWFMQ